MGVVTQKTDTNQAYRAVNTLRDFFRGVPNRGKTTKDRPIIWLDALRALDKIEEIIVDERGNLE